MDVEALLLDENYIRYCLGTADAATNQQWKEFKTTHPEHLPVLEEAAVLINGMYQWNAEQQLRQLTRPRKVSLYGWIAAAAAVTILAVAGYRWLRTDRLQPVVTEAGQLKKFFLSDSTLLYLQPGTRIQYLKGSRKVLLEQGTLYCEVKHDTAHPFTIETSTGYTVTDIGTAFHVSSDPVRKITRVNVTEGVVQIGAIELHAGETCLLDHEDVSLENVTVRQLLQSLQESYNVRFVVKNKEIMACKITTSFSKKEPIHNILDNLELVYGIVYTIRQQEIIIDGKGCN
ncbi:FecR family protein [Chitinophaga rhizophila]|uniref:FecR family protein n=1 Tax=Chitinophaga rhizophila TaxID=2866212 RepID=A0ABS7G5B2_9BACT|nr:FecR family protein [Chitinophaga rhizophila]MBW8682856.1 FecR family protein [Chitinophaga rhizophila]